MDKMDGKTMNIEQANVEKLKEVFPEVFADGKVDFDKLQGLLGHYIADDKEKYSFSWKGKADSLRLAQKRSTGTLRPCKEESKNWDTTENLYIEGDNLEVLKLLQSSYLNSIKMIYIDPPYNTGNDFVYTDDFADGIAHYKEVTGQATKSNPETAGRYHTNWLNMMYPRLKLARNLLTDDGVIFISIDDNEIANLRKLCDEVFGEDNFLGQITVVGNPRGRDYGGVARMHDYLLVYGRSYETQINLINDKDSEFKLFDSLGGFELRELRNRNIKFNKGNRPNLYYPFYINPKKQDKNGLFEISLNRQEGWIELYPLESQGVNTVWRWGKEKSLKNLNINIAAKPMKNGSYMIVEKYRESKIMARSVWWDKDTNTEKGTLLLKDLLNGKIFDYPKTVEMLMRTIQMGTESMDENIILDFFSGSATTAHAVMQLNAEDGGNRKFICVQLPEKTDEQSEAYKAGYKTICEIGKERIRRAGEKIKADLMESGPSDRKNQQKIKEGAIMAADAHWEGDPEYQRQAQQMADNLDIGFKVFKLDSSNLVKWDNTPTTDEEEVKKRIQQSLFYLVEGREDLDLVYEIMLKYGLSLTLPVEERKFDGVTAYIINHPDYKVLICLQPNITLSAVEEMDKETIGTYIFADRCFTDANILSNTEEILKKKDKEMRLF